MKTIHLNAKHQFAPDTDWRNTMCGRSINDLADVTCKVCLNNIRLLPVKLKQEFGYDK